jgi:hypothetical protein
MRTNGEFVSRVIQGLKALSKDGRISKRYVLFTGRDKANFLMSQKLDEMTLFKEEGIISDIPCVEMQSIDAIYCDIFEFKTCNTLMRSVNKLPEGLFGKNGSSIISVSNVDNSEYYTYQDPRSYASTLKRKYVKKAKGVFYTDGKYLYLPNSTTELVNISMIAIDKTEISNVSTCTEKQDCTNVWDSDFVCPDRFLDLVVKDTINEVASVWRTSVQDTNPNLDARS